MFNSPTPISALFGVLFVFILIAGATFFVVFWLRERSNAAGWSYSKKSETIPPELAQLHNAWLKKAVRWERAYLILTISAGIGSIVVVHLLIFLQARGMDYAAAVAAGTIFGPAQVGARVIERLFGQGYHPIWTMVASCVLMAVGMGLLFIGIPILLVAVILYGGGYGIMWIARGTLPLALFGAERYPVLMGRLAFPSLIVQALAPLAGAWMIEGQGAGATMAMLTAFALINVVLVAVLWAFAQRHR